MKSRTITALLVMTVMWIWCGGSRAGDLTPPGPRGPTMFTLEDIYLAVVGDSNVVDTASGTAAASEILDGKSAWVKGRRIAGTMPEVGQQNIFPGTVAQSIAAGSHDGTGQVAGDAALATGNIRAGVSIFGVAGKPEIVDTASGDATAAELLAGRKAWVQGAEIVGTMPIRSLSADSATVAEGFYAAATLDVVDTDLASGNIRAGVSIFGVAGKPEVVDTTSGDAVAGDLLAGRKAWVQGAEITGTMPIRSLSADSATVAEGFHAATTLNAVDSDLAPGNIKKNVGLFGFVGAFAGLGPGTYNAGIPRTGQTVSYSTGDDADLQKGIPWPDPRFTNHGDGTVSDNLTGLMWIRAPHTVPGNGGSFAWANALAFCSGLNYAGYDDWRLPNLRELTSLTDFEQFQPALPQGHPFVLTSQTTTPQYWTSTTYMLDDTYVWVLHLYNGRPGITTRPSIRYVLPVRGGP